MFEAFLGVNPWTSLFVLLNTLTIFFVAKKYLYVPVMNIIDERRREIDGMYEAAGEAQRQAEIMRTEYRQQLASARSTGEQLVREAVDRGKSREEEIIRKANAEASAIMDSALRSIALEKKKAVQGARDKIAGLSVAVAGKVIGRELTSRDHRVLIDRFIGELEDAV